MLKLVLYIVLVLTFKVLRLSNEGASQAQTERAVKVADLQHRTFLSLFPSNAFQHQFHFHAPFRSLAFIETTE